MTDNPFFDIDPPSGGAQTGADSPASAVASSADADNPFFALDPPGGNNTNAPARPSSGSPSYVAPTTSNAPIVNPGGILNRTETDEGWGPSAWASSAAKSTASGAIQGVSGAAGLVGGMRDLVNELGDRLYSWTSGLPLDQARTRNAAIRQQFAQSSVIPNVEDKFPNPADIQGKITPYTGIYQPESEAGRLGQAAVAGVTGGALLAPEAALTAAFPNAMGGMAAQGTYDVTGNPLWAAAAGVGAAGVAGAVSSDALATNFSQGARFAKVGNILTGASENPEQFAADLQAIPETNPQKFTTAQALEHGDTGIGQLEREVRGASPAPFIQRASEQAEQQRAAVDAIQSGASPEDVGAYFTAQARALNNQWQQAEDQARIAAQTESTNLGQGLPPSSAGQAISNELLPEYQSILGAARGQVSALGGTEGTDIYGGALRLQARAAADDAQERLDALYKAVPNNVTASIAPLKQTAQAIYGNMEPATRASMTPAESAVVDALSQYPSAVPFQSARALDTLITSSMREELKRAGFKTASYGRLVQLKNAWENAMSNSIATRAAQDNAAVASGAMSPEDALVAKINGWVSKFHDQQNSIGTSRIGVAGDTSGRTSRPIGASGTASQAGSGPGSGASPQAVSGQALPDPVTQAALDALATAKSAYKDYAGTYKSGAVGAVLRRAETSGSYKMPDYAVPAAVFPKGPKGTDAVHSYRNAVGNDADALNALHNYAASTLRKYALTDEGIFDPKGYAKWKEDYGPALKAAPEIAKEFDTAAHSSDALQKFGRFNPKYAPTNVPELFFAPGEAGAAGVDHLRSLIGRDKADAILSDHATALMKSAAEKNGVIDPVALAKWREKYGPAMSRMPDLSARFSDAGKATEAIAKVAANRKQAVEDYEKGMVGKLIGVNDPTTVQRQIGSIFGRKDAVPVMRDLVRRAQEDPSGLAMQGIRQAIVDHILSKFISTNKIGANDVAGFKPGTFAKFMTDNKPVMEEAFTSEDMKNWGAIVNTVERTNRSIAGSKLPGGSNTPQDILRALKEASEKGPNESLFGRLWKAALVSRELAEPMLEKAGLGHLALPLGVVGAVGSNVMAGLRNSGATKVADLLKEALLDPQVAKAAVMKASMRANYGSERALSLALRRLSLYGNEGKLQ